MPIALDMAVLFFFLLSIIQLNADDLTVCWMNPNILEYILLRNVSECTQTGKGINYALYNVVTLSSLLCVCGFFRIYAHGCDCARACLCAEMCNNTIKSRIANETVMLSSNANVWPMECVCVCARSCVC